MLAATVVGGSILLIAALFWPGLPMYDTIAQYRQVLGAPVDDWHPPAMVRLWQLLESLGEGTAPLFAAQVLLYSGGFALMVATLVQVGRWRAAVFLGLLSVSPLLLGWQMVVIKDTQMVAALVAAVALVVWSRVRNRSLRPPLVAVVVLLIGYATLLRHNSAFATIPLSTALLPPRRLVPTVVLAITGTAAALAASPLINHFVLGARPSQLIKAEPLFDLAGIAVRTSPSAPSPFTSEERSLLVSNHCSTPFFWDTFDNFEPCRAVAQRLLEQPAQQLYEELGSAAVDHPVAYLSHRLAHWNSTERWLVPFGLPLARPSIFGPNDVGLKSGANVAARTWEALAGIEAATPLGWPICWTAVALMALIRAQRRRIDPVAALGFALLVSAASLEISFIFISAASDLRYHLWPMTASALALVLLSDRIRLKKWEWVVGAVVLAAMIAGGMFTRASLPKAPDTYDGMLHATADWL